MNTIYESLEGNELLKQELANSGVKLDLGGTAELPARMFSAETFLKTNKADLKKFSPETIKLIRSNTAKKEDKPHLLALLPCGLRNAFKDSFVRAFPEYAEDDNGEVVIEGNLNYEKVFYKYIDSLTSSDELPDIFITSDFNNLYHHYFTQTFLNETYFERLSLPIHPFFEACGYAHPQGLFTMLTTNILVMMVDESKFENGPTPTSWKDLLNPSLSKSVVLRGDNDFFCNAVFYPFFKNYGEEAISQLAANTLRGMHPSEMVKAVSTGKTDNASVFVMPYSFALRIRVPKGFRMVWPTDGAIVSPVQMLVKKGSYQKYKQEIDFITGAQMGESLEQVGFPSANVETSKNYPGNTLNWLGWDFIAKHDIAQVKQRLHHLFFETYIPNK